MLNLVLFGGPGAGKGTQAEKLKIKYDLLHISTGDMLRAEKAQGTECGKRAASLMEKGLLVPDEVVFEMLKSKVDKNLSAKGFIFDGFPRTIAQAEMLDEMLAQRNIKIDAMIALDTPEDELVARLLNRGKISGRADDQEEGVIRDRVRVYREKTEPLIGYYQAQNKYMPIVGVGSIEQIFDNVCKAVDNC